MKLNPIIFSDLDLVISYQDSGKSFLVQAADLLAGTIRKTAIDNKDDISESLSKFVDFKIILP